MIVLAQKMLENVPKKNWKVCALGACGEISLTRKLEHVNKENKIKVMETNGFRNLQLFIYISSNNSDGFET